MAGATCGPARGACDARCRDAARGQEVVSARRGPAARGARRRAPGAAGRGSCTVLHGRSGSGKTTLLNLIAGVSLPTAGTIVRRRHRDLRPVRGARATGSGPSTSAMSSRRFNLLAAFSALENVMLAMMFAARRAAAPTARGGRASFWPRFGLARAARPQARAPLARRAAAGRHRAGAGERSPADPGGRALRQPRRGDRAARCSRHSWPSAGRRARRC